MDLGEGLRGRHVLVTGASGGLGEHFARLCASCGAAVTVAARRRERLDALEAELREAGAPHARAVSLDVAYQTSVDNAFAEALSGDAPPVDVIVNNAVLAGDHSKPLLETEPEDWDAMMAVNLRGPYLLCRAAVRQMLSQPLVGDARGRIVNITSQHGMVGCPGHFAYSVGKGGLVQMTRQIAVDYGPQGILCNAVAPGKIVTGTAGDLSASEEGLAYVRSRTPFARLGRSEDVAAAVAYLAGEAGYTSGINLMVDGGWMAY